MHAAVFRAGASATDITPAPGTLINGELTAFYARYIHDPLYARAVVMEKEGCTMAIVIVDICAMPKDFIDEVKSAITSRTGISRRNILIAATHTHAAGSVASLFLCEPDMAYRKKLPALILQAVVQAKANSRPAMLAFGVADAPEHLVCRRYVMKEGYEAHNPVTGGLDAVKTNPVGSESFIAGRASVTDPACSFMALKDHDGNWIAVLGNYNMHYAGDWEAGTITADYFGVFSKAVQETLQAGGDFVAMLSNGTSGEVNIWDFMDPHRYPSGHFAKSELIGKDLARKVCRALEGVVWQPDPSLEIAYEELSLPLRKPSPEDVEAAAKTVSATDYTHAPSIEAVYAREQVLLHGFPDTMPFPVQAFKIGNGIIGALGGEFFSETGLWLKRRNKAAAHYFTICLANGYAGYVPPAHELVRGGYETWRCRNSCLAPAAEEIIRHQLWQFIQQMPAGARG